MSRTLLARFVWVDATRRRTRVAIRVDAEGRIQSIEPAPESVDVPAIAVFPGLVNAHVHLQLAPLHDVPADRSDFVAWIRRVVAEQRCRPRQEAESAVRGGLARLLASGCTAVGEIDSTGLSHGLLAESGFAGRCYRELTGFDRDEDQAAEMLAERRRPERAGHARARSLGGWSPHAPYSVSPALFRAAVEDAPSTIHVAEAAEELELLATGGGAFRDLLEELGRWPGAGPSTVPGCSPVRWLDRIGVFDGRHPVSVVHGQLLSSADVDVLIERRVPLVVCPGAMQWFGRPPMPLAEWIERGLVVALGTDSLAGNDDLSMLREIAIARRLWPELPPSRCLEAATLGGAAALGISGLGRLDVGCDFDAFAVAVRPDDDPVSLLAAVSSAERFPSEVWLRGRACLAAGGRA